jgi:hypothetical protein
MLTLGQAAKLTGLSKTAIARAIKSGRLSGNKGETGEYQIDPTELSRVYTITVDSDRNAEQQATPRDTGESPPKTDLWRELLQQVENERDDLRRRLDSSEAAREREAEEREKSAAELRRLTLLITHQAPPSEPPAAPTPRQWPTPWTYWLAGIAAALAVGLAVWELWPRQP